MGAILNWNLEMLLSVYGGEPENLEKNPPSRDELEPTTNSANLGGQLRESNPGHIGGRRELSPLYRPCSP